MKEIVCLLFFILNFSNILLAGDHNSSNYCSTKFVKKPQKHKVRAISSADTLRLQQAYDEKYEETLLNLTIIVPKACRVLVEIYLPIKAHITVFLSDKKFKPLNIYFVENILTVVENKIDIFWEMSPNEYDNLVLLINDIGRSNNSLKKDVNAKLGNLYFNKR